MQSRWAANRLVIGLSLTLTCLVGGIITNGVFFKQSDAIVTSITRSGSENFTWAFNQIRVEFYRLMLAAQQLKTQQSGVNSDQGIAQLRQRYELFVSRIDIVSHGVYREQMAGTPIYDESLSLLHAYSNKIDAALGDDPGFTPNALAILPQNEDKIGKDLDLLTAKAVEVDSVRLNSLRSDLLSLRKFEIANLGLQVLLLIGFGSIALVSLMRLVSQKTHLQQVANDLELARKATELAAKAERRALERALREEQRTSQLQRRFVSMTSHEFRTPLAIIDSSAQRLLRKIDKLSSDEIAQRIIGIRDTVARLGDLLETILEAGRAYDGRTVFSPSDFDLRALITRLVREQGDISPNHRIGGNLEGLPESFFGDPRLITQIVVNLLSNAVKYSPKNGHVEVVGKSSEGDVTISVIDNGIGIPPDELENIFDVFYRASTSAGISGTGIGLDLVRKFVEMHGGQITVVSVPQEGSVFTIRLPISTKPSTASSSQPVEMDETCDA